MNKKLVAVICIAVLVLSCASARIINFGVGGTYGLSSGNFPTSEEGATYDNYSSKGFGFDSYLSLTFGRRAELFLDTTVGLNESMPFSDEYVATLGLSEYELYNVIGFRSRFGYEHAAIVEPFKLSLGVCGSLQMIMTNYAKGDLDGEYETKSYAVINMGVGLTAKAEFPMVKHLSLFVKGDFDFYTNSFYSVGVYHYPEAQENDGIPKDGMFVMQTDENYSVTVSAGLVVYI